MSHYQHVQVIINPAAGGDGAILNTLNTVFAQYDQPWDARITHAAGDATALTKAAIADGADLIAAYGGDGTVMEVANGLIGTDIPLAILPGGTGNALAVELGIPLDLTAAVELICNEDALLRPIDIGQSGDQYFMLRASIGLQAALAEKASREMKERFGFLAYILSGLDVIRQPQRATFTLTIDGEEQTAEGITCLVANSAGVGAIKLRLSATTLLDDGLLDVFVLDEGLDSALSMAASILEWEGSAVALRHWQGRAIKVEADPALAVRLDGESYGETPFSAEILPGALRVVVAEIPEPPSAADAPADIKTGEG